MRLLIRPSNLCLRFYVSDNWDTELIHLYFGDAANVQMPHPDDRDPYYIIDRSVGTEPYDFKKVDVKRILRHCKIVHCWFWTDGERNRTDEEILRAYLL
jgi:hypothetical protein